MSSLRLLSLCSVVVLVLGACGGASRSEGTAPHSPASASNRESAEAPAGAEDAGDGAPRSPEAAHDAAAVAAPVAGQVTANELRVSFDGDVSRGTAYYDHSTPESRWPIPTFTVTLQVANGLAESLSSIDEVRAVFDGRLIFARTGTCDIPLVAAGAAGALAIGIQVEPRGALEKRAIRGEASRSDGGASRKRRFLNGPTATVLRFSVNDCAWTPFTAQELAPYTELGETATKLELQLAGATSSGARWVATASAPVSKRK